MGDRLARSVLGVTAAAALMLAGAIAPQALQAAPTPTAGSTSRDIVLVIDTTGMAEEDFRLVQRAVAGMVSDPLLPQDGTVAVAMVQFRNDAGDGDDQAATVTVPLSALEGATSVESVISRVRAARPMEPALVGGRTALAIAGDLVAGRATTSTVIMIAQTSPPADLDLRQESTRAAERGLDRLTVFALDNRDPELSRKYQRAVVGRGVVTAGSALADVLTQLNTSLQAPALTLRALEITQVIQDWNNSVPLIEGKDTMVRAFLRGPDQAPITARLWGYRGGEPMPEGPLSPLNLVAYFPTPTVGFSRENLYESLNFLLPNSWVSNDIELRLAYAGPLDCSPAPGVGADCTTSLSFIETDTADVDFFAISYWSKGQLREPSTAALWEQMLRIRDQLPVDNLAFRFRTFAQPFTANSGLLDAANTALLGVAAQEHCASPVNGNCLRRYLGVIDNYVPNLNGTAGVANEIPGTVASYFLLGTDSILSTGRMRNVGVHEIAHTFGAHHVTNVARNGTSSFSDGTRAELGWCGEAASEEAEDYPYFSTITPPTSAAREFPTLGPRGDPDTEIWGGHPRSILWNSQHTVVDPGTTFPLMSYCEPLAGGQGSWMSLPTYNGLIDYMGGQPLAPASRNRPRASAQQILVRGVANFVEPGSSRIDPVIPLDTFAWIDDRTQGEWALELVDETGEVIDERAFTLARSAYYPINGEPPPHPDAEPFAILFDDDGALDRVSSIRLLLRGEVVAELAASQHAPEVTLRAPLSRATLDGQRIDISWSARDVDADPLSTTVHYRPSDRDDWMVLASDVPGTSLSVARDRLPAVQGAQVRVIVSDGIRWASDEAIDLRIANNRPLVSASPLSLEGVFVGTQALPFHAEAWDPDEGDLGDFIRWISDRDGPLMSGNSPHMLATELSEGTHVISIRVEDSDGGVTTTRVGSVRIRHVDYDFPAPPGPVRAVRAAPSGGQLIVSWSPPANSGSSPVTRYVYSVNGGSQKSTTKTRLVLPLPRPGTTVTLSIAARNSETTGKAVKVAYRSK